MLACSLICLARAFAPGHSSLPQDRLLVLEDRVNGAHSNANLPGYGLNRRGYVSPLQKEFSGGIHDKLAGLECLPLAVGQPLQVQMCWITL